MTAYWAEVAWLTTQQAEAAWLKAHLAEQAWPEVQVFVVRLLEERLWGGVRHL